MTISNPANETRNSNMTRLADLTSRELEIIQLVLAGKTNKGIASEMCISTKTVEFHLDNIYRKLGVQTRMMAGIWTIQQSLQLEA